MSHLQSGVQLHREPSITFSTSRALFTTEHHDSWSARGGIEVFVVLAEIGPQLYVLMATPLASTLRRSETACPLFRCSLWECSGSGYDEDSRRVWVSPTPDSRIMLSIAEDVEYWALVRLIFESRDMGRRRSDEMERLSLQALTLLPTAVDNDSNNERIALAADTESQSPKRPFSPPPARPGGILVDGSSSTKVKDLAVLTSDMSSPTTPAQVAASQDVQSKVNARHPTHAILSHVVDVVSTAAKLMKLPLTALLAILAITYLSLGSWTLLIRAVRSTVPSPCNFPGLGSFAFCDVTSPTVDSMSSLQRADFPGLIKIQNVVLDELMEDSESGTALALNIKHAELAVKDLVVVVRSSSITVKDVLADALNDFAADARAAARGLQRLSARIHGTVDSISSFNTFALESIETAKRGGGVEVSVIVLRTFRGSMLGFSSQIARVVVEATVTMANLDRLEDRLSMIHQLNFQESFATDAAVDDLLWELWTIFGGNQEKLRDLRNRAQILKDVERYRAVTVAYVAAASYTLQGVESELQALRDRLTEYVADSEEIPVEVHLASIERSVRRLREEKLRMPTTASITAV